MSDFSKTYFKRFLSYQKQIADDPSESLFLSIVIPSFNEPDLCKSLQSIAECELPEKTVEVIVVINSPENCPDDILEINKRSYRNALKFAKQNSSEQLRIHILNFENLPKKFAGVGLARKIGMDEALRRFGMLNMPEGLIAGFDADAAVDKNYLREIEKYFNNNPEANACSIHFEHPLEGNEFDTSLYLRIINYELHLRYLNEAMRFANFPYAFHTVGSSFIVRADVYAKQGGMNRKKAGEDFYFIQKIIPLGNYGEINSTKVIPSPRMSDRVPFGTGAAVKKMIETGTLDFQTYDFEVFQLLHHFFKKIDDFYINNDLENEHISLIQFLNNNKFTIDLIEIRKNSSDLNVFRKRFFDWFNTFRLIKYLNFAHNEHFEKKTIKSQAKKLAETYFSANFKEISEKDLLLFFREKQIKSDYKIKIQNK